MRTPLKFLPLLLILLPAFLLAQPCSMQNTLNCPCAAGVTPCVQAWMGTLNTAYLGIEAGVAALPSRGRFTASARKSRSSR